MSRGGQVPWRAEAQWTHPWRPRAACAIMSSTPPRVGYLRNNYMITIKIEGMSCGHCVSAVEKALGAVPGVSRVDEVSLERGEARIEGLPDPDQLVAAIEEEGYEARVV